MTISTPNPGGLSLSIYPRTISLSASPLAPIEVRALGAPGSDEANYQAEIQAAGPGGSPVFSLPYAFHVVPLIQISPFVFGNKVNVTVKAGSTVYWISEDFLNEEGDVETFSLHSVAFQNLAATSPVLQIFDSWSYTFSQPGVYTYTDPQDPFMTGTVDVVAAGST